MDINRFYRRRLQNIGVRPKDARVVAEALAFQYKSMGSDGFLAYFKKVGDAILSYLNGTEKISWVHTVRRFPKVIYALKKYPETILLRVAKLSRVVLFKELRPQQVEKVVNGATLPFMGSENSLTDAQELIFLGAQSAGFKPAVTQPSKPKWLLKCQSQFESVSGPVPKGRRPPVLESLSVLKSLPELSSLPYVVDAFYPLRYLSSAEFALAEFEESRGPHDGSVGRIFAAQEPGGKLRMYAAPHAIVQCLLYPIHNFLDKFRRRLVTDCTYDQEAGALWAQGHLAAGRMVHSVDLSTATCRFPLAPQLYMLGLLGLEQVYIDALSSVCRGTWVVDGSLQPQFPATLSWAVGQPLGITPSMSMFSLAHNLLLAGICKKVGVSPKDSFRVLGDDVVIVEREVYEMYIRVISDLGIPISHDKSHNSTVYAEFAGFSIRPTVKIRPGRWRQAGELNHLSLAQDLGVPLEGEVSERFLTAQKIVLFASGQYDPPVEEWPKYIASNSLLYSLEGLGTSVFTGKSFHEGATEYLKKVLKDSWLFVHTNYPNPLDMLDPLEEAGIPGISRSSVDAMVMRVFTFAQHVQQVYLLAAAALHNAVVNGIVSLGEAYRILDKSSVIASSLLWGEDRRLHRRDTSYTAKVLKTWDSLEIVTAKAA